MRFLIAAPMYPDSFADNVASALRACGHEVYVPPATSATRYQSRISALYLAIRQRSLKRYRSSLEKWIVRSAKTYRPDVVLAITQVLQEEVLRDLKRLGVRLRVAWWGDAPGNIRGRGLLSSEWDFIFLKDPDAVRKFRLVGLNAHMLHQAMNPRWHRQVAAQANSSVAVVGNLYGYRQFLVMHLRRKGYSVGLYGGRVPVWATPEIRQLHTGKYVVKEEKSRVFGEAVACLNSTSPVEGNSLNVRLFEIAAAGGLQIMEHKSILPECFEPGREVLVFNSLDELDGHVDRALRAPDEMKRIRDAAAVRAASEHTYEVRVRKMVNVLNG